MAKRLCLCKLNDPPLGHNSFVSPVRDKHKGYAMGGEVRVLGNKLEMAYKGHIDMGLPAGLTNEPKFSNEQRMA